MNDIKSLTGNGGSFYLDAPEAELKIEGSTTVKDSEATVGRGGLVYVNKAKVVHFFGTLTSFYGMKSALEGSIIYTTYNLV